MYKTDIIGIGDLVHEFVPENLLILFGPEATDELKEISVIHHNNNEERPDTCIKENGKLIIGNQEYNILQVGDEANQNFKMLGHIAITFSNSMQEILPGSILVAPKEFPKIEVTNQIIFD